MIGFSQIRDFATLVNKSRICDDDGRAKVNYYKAVNEKKGKGLERGKPYDNRGRGNTSGGKKPVNGSCYNCGERGHMSYDCPKK
ncbi:cellular nucleic acid-binding protein, partial [Trifolium medium]|nr:cellular nucleic acid-binding protein [Trifolium medium]